MPLASSLTPESRFMALFVGPKHSGKTAAACSWYSKEGTKKVKVHDGDGRIRGLLGVPWIDLNRIVYDNFPPKAIGGKNFFERVNADLDALMVDLASGKCNYETMVADSATAICKNLVLDALPLTHTNNNREAGRRIGTLPMPGQQDYGFESTGFDAYLSFLRSIPLNVIVTAHVIDKWDKPLKEDGTKDSYAENVIVGEKVSLRDKIAANCTIYFDHIFRFDRKVIGGQEKFFVEFISDIACTSFPGLKPGRHDITGKNFREFVLGEVSKATTK